MPEQVGIGTVVEPTPGVDLQGFLNKIVPTVPDQWIGDQRFIYNDPIALLLEDDQVPLSVKQFYCQACGSKSFAQFLNVSQFDPASPPQWECFDDAQSFLSPEDVCNYVTSWAYARQWALVTGQPMPPCQYTTGGQGGIVPGVPTSFTLGEGVCAEVHTPLTAPDIVNAMNDGTFQDATNLAFLQVTGVGGDSPLAVAIDKAPATSQTQLGGATATTLSLAVEKNLPEIFKLLGAILFPEADAIIMADVILEWVVNRLLPWIQQNIKVEIVCDTNIPPGFSMHIQGESPYATLIYNLYPTINCSGGENVDVQDMQIAYNTCNKSEGQQQLLAPTLVGPSGETLQPLMQLIVDKLANLEQCCPPCNLQTNLLVTGAQGVNNVNLPLTGDFIGYDSLQWVIRQEGAQILAEFSNPPRWKYGTFSFKYEDGSYSQPQFINYNGQRFFVPHVTAPCVGIAWHLAPDVIADVYGNAKLDWQGGIFYP